jgi:hypothetical protein
MRALSINKLLISSLLFTALLFCHGTRAAKPPSKAACNAALQAALVTNLSFGDYEGAIAGTITVDTAGARTTTGPILAGGVASAAAYDVWTTLAGCEKRNITVTLPGTATLTGPVSMTANNFTKNPPNKFKLTAPAVPTRVTVGASLNSTAGQAGGPYTTTFTVDFTH